MSLQETNSHLIEASQNFRRGQRQTYQETRINAMSVYLANMLPVLEELPTADMRQKAGGLSTNFRQTSDTCQEGHQQILEAMGDDKPAHSPLSEIYVKSSQVAGNLYREEHPSLFQRQITGLTAGTASLEELTSQLIELVKSAQTLTERVSQGLDSSAEKAARITGFIADYQELNELPKE